MNFDDLLGRYGLPLAELVIVVVAFVTGKVIPRFIYDQERFDRKAIEDRFDRSLDINEALIAELKKAKGA